MKAKIYRFLRKNRIYIIRFFNRRSKTELNTVTGAYIFTNWH